MIEIHSHQKSLTVVDIEKNQVKISIDCEIEEDALNQISRPIDACVSGYGRNLCLPKAGICIDTGDTERWHLLDPDDEAKTLSNGENLIQIEATVCIYIKFYGNATLKYHEDSIEIVFPERKNYWLGFRSNVSYPKQTIQVTSNIDDIARGISYLSSSIRTRMPERSYPSLRSHPARFGLGNELIIPDQIQSGLKNNSINIKVPEELAYIYVSSPLVFYLQAELIPEDRTIPILEIPDRNFRVTFPQLPEYQYDIKELLSRVFYMDTLCREGGPYKIGMFEMSKINNFDADSIYRLPPEDRLIKYIEYCFDDIEYEFPNWHLTSYIRPSLSNIEILPYLIKDISVIYLSEYADPVRSEGLDSILQADTRGLENANGRSTASLSESKFHAWVAEGLPYNTFKPSIESFENQLQYNQTLSNEVDVLVVVNSKMMKEAEIVEDIYKKRAKNLPINIDVQKDISREHLRSLFSTPYDYIHFANHSTDDGLLCTDGYFDVGEIEKTKIRTFFFNSCQSMHEGQKMIETGSVAGIVTTKPVLNQPATVIGSVIAELLAHGFTIEWANQIARHSRLTDHGYFVLGDGGHTMGQPHTPQPTICYIDTNDGKQYDIIVEANSHRNAGACYEVRAVPDTEFKPTLVGNNTRFSLTKSRLIKFLNEVEMPAIFNGEYYWTKELKSRLLQGDL